MSMTPTPSTIDISSILNSQKRFFNTGKTLPLSFRIEQLKKIKSLLEIHEKDIAAALKKDLHKSAMESIVTEILLVIEELNFIIKNLHTWMKPTKVSSLFPFCFPGKSTIHYQPYGSVFIIGPWNYPFMLVMSPLIGAICAGNCAIIKPSELASHTQDLIIKLINTHFSPDYLVGIQASPQEMAVLLEHQYDYIFFTGGIQIGKIIMQAASKHLTPVTLELGGKSPCIVDETANLDYAARRIIWAKFMNAGQVCLAPDYVLVHSSCKNALIEKMKSAIIRFYSEDPEKSESYCRIINKKHFQRLKNLMDKGNIIVGGESNEADLYIAPTLIDNLSQHDAIMQEEIFGPLLPILTYDKQEDLIDDLKCQSKPLALYVFTKNKSFANKLLSHVSFGGGCINDCVLQVANYHLPFGGVGSSGIGSYHGKYSFQTFSHQKSIFHKTWPIDLDIAYPPYQPNKLKWLRRLITLSF